MKSPEFSIPKFSSYASYSSRDFLKNIEVSLQARRSARE